VIKELNLKQDNYIPSLGFKFALKKLYLILIITNLKKMDSARILFTLLTMKMVYIKPSLAKSKDVKSDVINPVVTFLQGNEQKLFICFLQKVK
jgi:hypothetical protein